MKLSHLAKLEECIDTWFQDVCGDVAEQHDIYFHDNLVEQMAIAAEQVFDSAIRAQEYAVAEGHVKIGG